MERIEPLRVKTPSSIIMVGPSGCGKTCFTESLLSRHHQELFVNTTSVIVYCYGDWQDKFRSMKKGGVKFHEGIVIITPPSRIIREYNVCDRVLLR